MRLTPLDPTVVAADVRPPPLSDLARRARRRNRRRRAAGAAAALTAVAAAAALAWPLGPGRPTTPATDESPPPTSETYVSPPMATERHRYTIPLNRTAALAVGQTGCGIAIQVTIDSGQTWTAPGGPPALPSCAPGADLPISQTIVGVHAYRFTVAGTTWFTRDAGRTWTTVHDRDRAVEAFGSGSSGASLDCVDGCDRPRAVDGGTGELLTLRHAPPFDRLSRAVYADQSTIWVLGAPEPGRPLRASHSDDLGRTWSAPVDLPVSGEDVNIRATGPRRAYLYTLKDIYRTDDGGQNWVKLDPPTTFFTGLTETMFNRLIILSGSEVWISTDAGTTFTGPLSVNAPPPLSAGVVGGLVKMTGGDNVVHVHDGSGWFTIQPPR